MKNIKAELRRKRRKVVAFFLYAFSSLSATAMDFIVFAICNRWLFLTMPVNMNIALATLFSRLSSSVYNLVFNHKMVFHSKSSLKKSAVRFYFFVIAQMIASGLLVIFFVHLTQKNAVLIKMIVDTGLFFVGFPIQRKMIF